MIMQKSFQGGHWSFLGPGEEVEWYGTSSYKTAGKWTEDANLMIGHFTESFRGIRAFNRGIVKKKGGRSTIHFTAEFSNIGLFFRTTDSANQLSSMEQYRVGVKNLPKSFLEQKASHVDKSISRENDQLSKRLNPQEVNFVSTQSNEDQGTSWKELAFSSQAIQRTGSRRAIPKHSRTNRFCETSLCWTELQNHSRFE